MTSFYFDRGNFMITYSKTKRNISFTSEFNIIDVITDITQDVRKILLLSFLDGAKIIITN